MSYNGRLANNVEAPHASVIVLARVVEAALTATVVAPWRVVATVLPIAHGSRHNRTRHRSSRPRCCPSCCSFVWLAVSISAVVLPLFV